MCTCCCCQGDLHHGRIILHIHAQTPSICEWQICSVMSFITLRHSCHLVHGRGASEKCTKGLSGARVEGAESMRCHLQWCFPCVPSSHWCFPGHTWIPLCCYYYSCWFYTKHPLENTSHDSDGCNCSWKYQINHSGSRAMHKNKNIEVKSFIRMCTVYKSQWQ